MYTTISATFLALNCLLCSFVAGQQPIPLDPTSGGRSIETSALTQGDIIVSTTTEKVSEIIKAETNAKVSHAMIFVGVLNGNPMVIEAIGDKVVKRLLKDALSKSNLAVAVQHPNNSIESRKKLVMFAEAQVGKKYNTFGVVNQLLCRHNDKLCKIEMLNATNDTWYCSELVFAAYQEAGLSLTTQKPKFNDPGVIEQLVITNKLKYVGHLKTP